MVPGLVNLPGKTGPCGQFSNSVPTLCKYLWIRNLGLGLNMRSDAIRASEGTLRIVIRLGLKDLLFLTLLWSILGLIILLLARSANPGKSSYSSLAKLPTGDESSSS